MKKFWAKNYIKKWRSEAEPAKNRVFKEKNQVIFFERLWGGSFRIGGRLWGGVVSGSEGNYGGSYTTCFPRNKSCSYNRKISDFGKPYNEKLYIQYIPKYTSFRSNLEIKSHFLGNFGKWTT